MGLAGARAGDWNTYRLAAALARLAWGGGRVSRDLRMHHLGCERRLASPSQPRALSGGSPAVLRLLRLLALALLAAPLSAQNGFQFTIDNIMRGPEI